MFCKIMHEKLLSGRKTLDLNHFYFCIILVLLTDFCILDNFFKNDKEKVVQNGKLLKIDFIC